MPFALAAVTFSLFWAVAPVAKQDVTVELFYNSVWNDHTDAALVRDIITITRGRSDESSQPAPTTCSLSFLTWRFNPANPASDLHGLIGRNTPLRVTVGTSVRFTGEVSSWTPRQSLGGPNVPPNRWVEVEAAGITRRLGQGQDPLTDALHRYLTVGDGSTENPVGYWPMAGSHQSIRQAVIGQPFRLVRTLPSDELVQLAPGDLAAPWLPPGTTIQGTGPPDGLLGNGIFGRAGMDSGEDVEVTVDAAFRFESGNLENRAGHQWVVSGENSAEQQFSMDLFSNNFDGLGGGDEQNPAWRWEFRLGTFADPDAYEHATLDFLPLADGAMHVVRFTALLSPATDQIAWSVYFDGSLIMSGTATSVPLSTLRVNRLNLATYTINPAAIVYGPVAVWAGSPPPVAESLDAFLGHVGEHAGDRFVRLTGEEGISANIVSGDAGDTVPCGPQYPDGLLAILREAADVDQGTVNDRRSTSTPGIHYRTGRSRYNRDAVLALDYAQAQVAPPLDPVVDDQGTRNDVTVKRRDGGEARKVDQASVDAIGRTSASATVNCLSDVDAGNQAGWRLHLGTTEGTRFPRVTVDLDASPELVAAADAVDVGNRVTIANLPAELTPDLASLIVQGYTETVASHRRKITYVCTPEEPYHIAEVEHADYSILGSLGATVAGEDPLTTTETDVTVHNGGGPDWVHEADFDILVGGERMTVTAVGPVDVSTFPNHRQIFTVVRSVNGVVKEHPGGARVELFHKSYIGL